MNLPSKIYFLGIGGIGMSALARYFNSRGVEVHGYDRTCTELTKQLSLEGMTIHYEENTELIPLDCELVIRTPAVPKDSIEYQYIVKHNFTIKKRSQVLGEITRNHKCIAVAGTHGKTSTSILIAHVLHSSGLKLTAFLGGISNNFKSNFIDSGDDYMVVEADEYDRSFLQLHPDIAVINSLDADHLDIYGSRENMVESYLQFAGQIEEDGLLLLSHHISSHEVELFQSRVKSSVRVVRFGKPNLDAYSSTIQSNGEIGKFVYQDANVTIDDIVFKFPGKHNVENATAAIYIGLTIGISTDLIRKSLSTFEGIHRRFEILYSDGITTLIDDYAHHPTEIAAAIEATRAAFPNRHLLGIFQPHLFSRTKDFYLEFANVLSQLDELILLDIYPARELPMEGVSSQLIFDYTSERLSKILTTKEKLIEILREKKLDVVLVLGAGDIDTKLNDIVGLIKSRL